MKRDLNIIDLISEKHIILRRGVEERWAELEEEDISHTEALCKELNCQPGDILEYKDT